MYKVLIYYVCLLCILLHVVSALVCHQCAEIGGDDCGDPYDPIGNDNTDDCGDKDTHCVKYKTIIKIRDSGYINGRERESVIVSRLCERLDGRSDGCKGQKADSGIIIKCICSTDGCNGAGFTTVSVGVLMFGLVAHMLASVV
ncbi:uncharacterized protein LOC121380921 [Gigantopelta aegis]|uniref:uncharacterized protein LOC121380921 n=1 Tax=Gigantopelta aegis TaxID=1735272 RepID=UPI001B887F29|nr:uncharacterized protein LOC121380921 [Gigantopelta aegis]